jgi:TRAP-type mannitol/chloroaromatic compound transport system substrate-binding protein
MKKKFFAIALVALLVFTLAACGNGNGGQTVVGGDDPTIGETFHWRSQTFTATGTMYHDLHINLANKIYEMSGGRLMIETFGSGEIVAAFDMPNAVRDGILDAGVQAPSQWTLEYATPLYASTPGEFSDPNDMIFWLRFGGGWDIHQEMASRFNITTFPMAITHQENFLWAPNPVTSIADLQGLSIRMMPVGGDILAANGVAVVFMPGGEIVPAIERGVIDGGEFAVSSMDFTLGFHDVAQYYHKPGWHQPSLLLEFMINGDAWNALPADIQAIVEVAAYANTAWSTMYSAVRNVEAEVFFQQNGNQLVILPDEMVATLNQWKDDFFADVEANDPFFRRVRDSQRNFMQWWVPNRDLTHIDDPAWVRDRADEWPFVLVPLS